MTAFEIMVRLPDGGDPLSDENLDALHARKCDYVTFSTHGDGLLMASFDMDGDPAEALALTSARLLAALPGSEIVKAVVIEEGN